LRAITWPRNDLFAVRSLERDLVVVLGEEPHHGWRSFTNELVEALQRLGVRRAVTMGATGSSRRSRTSSGTTRGSRLA